MSGVQTRLQRDAGEARQAAEAASAAAGDPPPPLIGMAPGQGTATDQMLPFLVAQMAHQQRVAAAQLAQQTAAAAEAAAASEAALAQAAAATAASIAQRQRDPMAAGATPLFHGKVNSIEMHRWLLALDQWFDSAHISATDEKTRLEVAVAAFRDDAQTWWAAKRSDGAAATLRTWSEFAQAVRKSFMPIDVERWATRERDALVSAGARNKNVLEYTANFNMLDMLLRGEREMTRVMAYERDLPMEYSVKCAERRFATLTEATTAMTALWHAKEGARRTTAASLSNTETEELPRGPALSSCAASTASAPPPALDRVDTLCAQVAQLTAMMAERFEVPGRERGRGGRQGARSSQRQAEGVPRARSRTPGLSDEFVRSRIRAGQCIRCGQEGHYKADCTNEAKLN